MRSGAPLELKLLTMLEPLSDGGTRVHFAAELPPSELTFEEVGDDRFTMVYRVVSEAQAVVAAEGDGRIVMYDYTANTKAPIPPSVRARIAEI